MSMDGWRHQLERALPYINTAALVVIAVGVWRIAEALSVMNQHGLWIQQ